MTNGIVEADAEMRAFCEHTGELIYWASAIDAQLTKAVIRAFSLTETPMLEPIVAELDARAKVAILRARSKHIKPVAWSKGITRWVNKAEKVNGYSTLSELTITPARPTAYGGAKESPAGAGCRCRSWCRASWPAQGPRRSMWRSTSEPAARWSGQRDRLYRQAARSEYSQRRRPSYTVSTATAPTSSRHMTKGQRAS